VAHFPSAEWFEHYCAAINESEEHAISALDWEGDVTFVIEDEPHKGVPETMRAWLDLHRGMCRGAKLVSQDEGERARFVISAPYSRWKEVIQGRLDPIRGMREGKLRLQGDLPAIVAHVDAARLLVGLASTIPTEFPDD
jgi:putative sterol carrier protein